MCRVSTVLMGGGDAGKTALTCFVMENATLPCTHVTNLYSSQYLTLQLAGQPFE